MQNVRAADALKNIPKYKKLNLTVLWLPTGTAQSGQDLNPHAICAQPATHNLRARCRSPTPPSPRASFPPEQYGSFTRVCGAAAAVQAFVPQHTPLHMHFRNSNLDGEATAISFTSETAV